MAGKTVVGPVNDSDEWGEKESEENQQEDDGKHGDESCAQDEARNSQPALSLLI